MELYEILVDTSGSKLDLIAWANKAVSIHETLVVKTIGSERTQSWLVNRLWNGKVCVYSINGALFSMMAKDAAENSTPPICLDHRKGAEPWCMR